MLVIRGRAWTRTGAHSTAMYLIYYIVLGLVALQRIAELILSYRNRSLLQRSGFHSVEPFFRFAPMVITHVLWLVCAAIEPQLWAPLALSPLLWIFSLLTFLLAQTLRYWAIASLGAQWNVGVMTLPPSVRGDCVSSGPYRYLRHPNYLAVVLEIIAVPLLGGAYVTAAVFSLVNFGVLVRRIRLEEDYLFLRDGYREYFSGKKRLLPLVW